MCRAGRLQASTTLKFDLHVRLDLQQERTRILQSPFQERHAERASSRPAVFPENDLHWQCHRMICAVQTESALQGDRGIAAGQNRTAERFRPEHNVVVFSTLENIMMHF